MLLIAGPRYTASKVGLVVLKLARAAARISRHTILQPIIALGRSHPTGPPEAAVSRSRAHLIPLAALERKR